MQPYCQYNGLLDSQGFQPINYCSQGQQCSTGISALVYICSDVFRLLHTVCDHSLKPLVQHSRCTNLLTWRCKWTPPFKVTASSMSGWSINNGSLGISRTFSISHPISFTHSTLPLRSSQTSTAISGNENPESSRADSYPEDMFNKFLKVVSFTFQLYPQLISAFPLFENPVVICSDSFSIESAFCSLKDLLDTDSSKWIYKVNLLDKRSLLNRTHCCVKWNLLGAISAVCRSFVWLQHC